jgi:hypothetical protein
MSLCLKGETISKSAYKCLGRHLKPEFFSQILNVE